VHGHTAAVRSVWKRVCFSLRAKTAGPKKFSADYASHNFSVWEKLLVHLRDRDIDVLEIGSFEGRSALFWLEFLRRCRLTCVDAFLSREVEDRFDRNTADYRDRIAKLVMPSASALPRLEQAGARFDLIYIDGSHRLMDVYRDSTLCWPLLKSGGILIWDDYEWTKPGRELDRPKPAINHFLRQHASELVELHRGYQIIVRKIRSSALSGPGQAAHHCG
jgi:predicted O-methyltransferase YrrM